MAVAQPLASRWRQAIDTAALGVWDLRPELETVHHSPQWKQRLGFPEPHAADSTHFWRCRVHPDDLDAMLAAMRDHVLGRQPHYESIFRLRSHGSGYRRVHSRGRVVERNDEGRALRLVGTMIDLTERPSTPTGGLPEGHRGSMSGSPLEWPFHRLLAIEGAEPGVAEAQWAQVIAERDRMLGWVEDLLNASMAELDAL